MQQLYKQWHEDVAGLPNLSQRRFGLDSPRGSILCSAWLVLSTLLLRKSCPPTVRTTKYETIHLSLSNLAWATQHPWWRHASLQSGTLVSRSQGHFYKCFTWEGTKPVKSESWLRKERKCLLSSPSRWVVLWWFSSVTTTQGLASRQDRTKYLATNIATFTCGAMAWKEYTCAREWN